MAWLPQMAGKRISRLPTLRAEKISNSGGPLGSWKIYFLVCVRTRFKISCCEPVDAVPETLDSTVAQVQNASH